MFLNLNDNNSLTDQSTVTPGIISIDLIYIVLSVLFLFLFFVIFVSQINITRVFF